jgi:hypothetical protein
MHMAYKLLVNKLDTVGATPTSYFLIPGTLPK